MPLQILRRIGTSGAPSDLEEGQLAYNKPATGSDALYIGGGDVVNLLVSSTRQLELTGIQTIAAGSTNAKRFATTNFLLDGGDAGDILSTDGNGNLSWHEAPPASVLVDDESALEGNGLTGNEITLVVATATQVTQGSDDVNPITSARLRDQTGADRLSLLTDAKTIIPAVNEIFTKITTLVAPLQFVGTYDVGNDELDATATGPAEDGALPAADASNKGWVVIVTDGGTGTGNAPHVAITVGDWLISNGDTWDHIDLDLTTVIAGNVGVSAITGMTGTNVQSALQQIFSDAFRTVVVDEETITGTGLTGDPLVASLDDGEY